MKSASSKGYLRRQSGRKIRRPFFDKQSSEEAAPFFSTKNGVQTKLAIGKANDPLENEADAAARQVVGQQQVQRAGQKDEEPAIQKAEAGKEEEKPVQKAEKEEVKPQAKLLQHREEKKMDEEMAQTKPDLQRLGEQKDEESVQTKSEANVQATAEKGERQEGGQAARPSLETLLKQRKGRGISLPDDLCAEMKQKFRAEFRQVHIHTDEEAVAMCDSIHAQAFTFGYDIYFNTGKYDPTSSGGKELLAHELAHVVQQKG
jgi:Domain of unknown function (DUF4157)